MPAYFHYIFAGVAAGCLVQAYHHFVKPCTLMHQPAYMQGVRGLGMQVFCRKKSIGNGYGLRTAQPDCANSAYTGRCGKGGNGIIPVVHAAKQQKTAV
jgi:hypothetical protein